MNATLRKNLQVQNEVPEEIIKPAISGKIIYSVCFLLILLSGKSQVNLSWSRGAGSSTVDCGRSVSTDASGNVYTAGFFTGNADFDPGATTFSLNTVGGQDIFIQKLNASGAFVWARSMGGIGDDMANEITVDALGNAITVGNFTNTVDFDPGAGSCIFTGSLGLNGFIQKLDPAGNFVWAKNLNATVVSVDLDNVQNICVTGVFYGVQDFDPGPATFTLSAMSQNNVVWASYVLKLDNNGNFLFAKVVALTSEAVCVRLDTTGNILTMGSFSLSPDFDPGSGTYTLASPGAPNFVSKLDPLGNFIWAKQLNTFQASTTVLETDNYSNICLAGYFSNSIDVDPGPAVYNFTTSFGAGWDAFVLKLDASGNFVWARQLTHTPSGFGHRFNYGITTDALRNVYVKGNFSDVADFDPGPGTFLLTAPSIITCSDFIQKLDENGMFVWAGLVNTACSNNTVNAIHVDASNNIYVAGSSYSGMDMDPGPQTYTNGNAGICDVFVSKFCQSPNSLHISGPSITCSSGGTFSIPFFSGATYTWSLPGGYVGASATNTIAVSNISTNGIITVTTSNACGSGSSNLAVTFTSAINLSVSTPSTICIGSYTTLTASGAASYSWSSGSQLNYVTVAPLSSTIYTVTGNALGCTASTKTVAVIVNSVFPSVVVNSQTVCYGYATNLIASGATTYSWNTGATSNAITVGPSTNTVYTVTGTQLGCSTSANASVTVEYSPNLDVVTNTSTCIGSPINLIALGASSFTWVPVGTGSQVTVNPSATTIYTLIGASPNGCLSQQAITVVVKPLPVISVSPAFINTVCSGEEITLIGSGAVTYTWFPDQTTGAFFSIKPSISTTYTLAVRGANGCKNEATVSVVVDPCTGLVNINSEQDAPRIYPNPSAGDFTIESTVHSEIEIYNLLGSCIFRSVNENGKVQFRISEKGIFFVKITKHERSKILKLIID